MQFAHQLMQRYLCHISRRAATNVGVTRSGADSLLPRLTLSMLHSTNAIAIISTILQRCAMNPWLVPSAICVAELAAMAASLPAALPGAVPLERPLLSGALPFSSVAPTYSASRTLVAGPSAGPSGREGGAARTILSLSCAKPGPCLPGLCAAGPRA